MKLDDTQPCGGMTDLGRLIGLCVSCTRRPRSSDDPRLPAAMLPPAQQDNLTGEWSCVERLFGGHRRSVVDLADVPAGITSVISRGDATR